MLFIIVCFPVIKSLLVKVAYSKLAFIYRFVHSATSASVWKGTLLCTRNFTGIPGPAGPAFATGLGNVGAEGPVGPVGSPINQNQSKSLFKCLFF